MKKIKVMIEWAGNNFSAGTGKINGVVAVTGKTIAAVKNNFKEAFDFHVKNSLADGDKLPKYVVDGSFDFDFELGASAMLHLTDGLISRAAISKVTGINEKQLSHYLTGHKVARETQNKKIASGIISLSKKMNELSALV